MLPKGPEKGDIKFNLITKEEIKKSGAEIEEVKKQIDKRTEQLKKNDLYKY
jgi:peptidoglycan hydrolase CwlO-like protein